MADTKRPAFRLTLRDTKDNTYTDIGAAWPSPYDGVYNVRLGNTSDQGACEVLLTVKPKGGKAYQVKLEKDSGFFLSLVANTGKKKRQEPEEDFDGPEASDDADFE